MSDRAQFWAQWDEDGPFCVLADGRTVKQAAKVLADETGVTDGGRYVLVPDGGEQPRQRKVWDCEYDGPAPCTKNGCRHDHEESVYVFHLDDAPSGGGR